MPEQMIAEPKKKVPSEETHQVVQQSQKPTISMKVVPKKITQKQKPMSKEQQELIAGAKESVDKAYARISTSYIIDSGMPYELTKGFERLANEILKTKKSGDGLFSSRFLSKLKDATPSEALVSAKAQMEKYQELIRSTNLAGERRQQTPEEYYSSMRTQSSIIKDISLAKDALDAMDKAGAADLPSIQRLCSRLSEQIKSTVFGYGAKDGSAQDW